MTTEQEIRITEADYDGMRTWAVKGQIDKRQFLLALVEQHADTLAERVREGRRMPTVEDVDHAFGMTTECFDFTFVEADIHKDVCDDTECEFDPEKCFWVTWLCDEALWPAPAPEGARQ